LHYYDDKFLLAGVSLYLSGCVTAQRSTRATAETARKRLTDCVRDNDEMTDLDLTYITPCPKETVLERMPGKALINSLGRATPDQDFEESHEEPVSVSELMPLLAFVAVLNAYMPSAMT